MPEEEIVEFEVASEIGESQRADGHLMRTDGNPKRQSASPPSLGCDTRSSFLDGSGHSHPTRVSEFQSVVLLGTIAGSTCGLLFRECRTNHL